MKLQKIKSVIYWAPRIICILAILFISLFALDAFEPGLSFWEQLGRFLIHLIPSFILTLFLIFAWNYELVGGIIFTLIGVILSPIIFKHNYIMNQSIGLSLTIIATITFPFIVVGILFIWNHFLNKSQKTLQ